MFKARRSFPKLSGAALSAALLLAATAAGLLSPQIGHAGEARAATYLTLDRPVGAEEIKIGLCNAQTGRIASLGSGAKLGVEALFAQVNAAGGVNGRKLRLVAYDDLYEPLNSVVATNKLINDDRVFALCSTVGTPTTQAVVPMLNEAGLPLVGALSGAESLRNPANPLVFNVRAGYAQETQALVDHLVADCGVKKIAVFVQADGYGDAITRGVERALKSHALALAGRGAYVRNSTDVDDALAALTAAQPEAVIMGGSYPACAAFVKAAQQQANFAPYYCSVSFVGTEPFIAAAGGAAEGVYISQVMPDPLDASNALVKDYQAAMRAMGQSVFTYSSLEGYANAWVLVEGLRAAGQELTVEKFIGALESLQLDLGGQPCAFGPSNRQGLRQIYLTKITGGKAVPVAGFGSAADKAVASTQH
ncbi:MAG: ABC transporter substrate-binding protein [Verrucomicrobia bacterium]|nr:ABC transporter substrate-binding protein [Verrucomicrobiota bacterium]